MIYDLLLLLTFFDRDEYVFTYKFGKFFEFNVGILV